MQSALALLISLAVCFGAAATGAVFRPGAWYAELAKPVLLPYPLWVSFAAYLNLGLWYLNG